MMKFFSLMKNVELLFLLLSSVRKLSKVITKCDEEKKKNIEETRLKLKRGKKKKSWSDIKIRIREEENRNNNKDTNNKYRIGRPAAGLGHNGVRAESVDVKHFRSMGLSKGRHR